MHRGFAALLLALGAGGALLAGSTPVLATDADSLARALLGTVCGSQPDGRYAGFELLDRTPVERDGVAVGERLRLRASDGWQLRVELLAPDGNLQRVMIEVAEPAVEGARPLLLVFADGQCNVRGGRRLLRRPDGRIEAVQALDAGLSAAAPPEPVDESPPTGTDTGGVLVAMVDAGVDYRIPSIGGRLARDASGAILGYDWWDRDPRPFDAHPAGTDFFVQRHGTRTASLMLAEAPVARLVPYRYPRPDMSRMRELIEQADTDGVRIVNLSLGGPRREEWEVFEQTALAHPHLLFVVSAGNDGRDIDQQPVYPAALSLSNLVVVTSANDDGTLAEGSNWGRRHVHLMVPGEQQVVTEFGGQRRLASGSSYAAARVSALAACWLAAHPDWDATRLRDALFAAAVPPPDGAPVSVGLLTDPLGGDRGACPSEPAQARVVDRRVIDRPAAAPAESRAELSLSLLLVRDSGWQVDEVRPALAEAGRLLASCGVGLGAVELLEVVAPRRLRQFSSRYSPALVEIAPPVRPLVFLVEDTLEPEPFEAEAIGARNAGRRRELVWTLWMTRAVTQFGLVLAHELVHLLADSGEHHPDPANLMHERSEASEGRLDEAQCARVLERGLATGLLVPVAR